MLPLSAKSMKLWPALVGLVIFIVLTLASLEVVSPPLIGSATSSIVRIHGNHKVRTSDISSDELGISFYGRLETSGNIKCEGSTRLSIITPSSSTEEKLVTVLGFEIENTSSEVIDIEFSEELLNVNLTNPPAALVVAPPIGAVVEVSSETCIGVADGNLRFNIEKEGAIRIFSDARDGVQLAFIRPKNNSTLINHILVTEINFWKPKIIDNVIQSWSGLSEGNVRFLSTPNVTTSLSSGDIFSIRSDSLNLRTVRIEEHYLQIHYSGNARSVLQNIGGIESSIKPTLYDVVANSSIFRMAFGFVSLILGIGLTINWNTASEVKN